MYLYSVGSFGLRRSCTEVQRPTFWWFCVNPGIPSQMPQKVTFFSFFFFHLTYSRWTSSLPSCLPVVTKDLPISPRFTPYNFLSRCKFSTLTTRQPMVEFYLLAFPRFRYERKNTNPTLVRIELTTSVLADVQLTY